MRGCSMAVLTLLIGAAAAAAQEPARRVPPTARSSGGANANALVRADVRRVLGPRLFTVEWSDAEHPELIVSAPDAEATPIAGTMVFVHGVIRPFEDADLEDSAGWNEIDPDTREAIAGAPVLLATSLTTAGGRQLIAGAPSTATSPRSARQAPRGTSREPLEARVRPGALSELIDELGGRYVTVPTARVIAVLNPRAFLIEPLSPLPAPKGNLDRVLVMVGRGQLVVMPSLLVGSDVKVGGVARTLLGIQLTREVPWPTELTPELIKRLEIRAAVLATSVQTADGVDLIEQPPSSH